MVLVPSVNHTHVPTGTVKKNSLSIYPLAGIKLMPPHKKKTMKYLCRKYYINSNTFRVHYIATSRPSYFKIFLGEIRFINGNTL
jgi:hypothetical protein